MANIKKKHNKRKGRPQTGTPNKERRQDKKTEHIKVPFEKPGNSLYPAPAVLVSCMDPDTEETNLFTVGWAGNVCSDPAMLSISVREERYSYHMIEKSGEFVVNLTTEQMAKATDFCGVRSGRNMDKWKETGLTPEKSYKVSCPSVHESPVSIECRVVKKVELGTHHMYIGQVLAVTADSAYFDEKNTFHLRDANPIAYSHGKYYTLGRQIGHFGYSVKKKKRK